MRTKSRTVEKLLGHYREIATLGKIKALLDWDLNVNLPPKAAEERAAQSAYMAGIAADKWLEPSFRKLLKIAQEESLTDDDAAVVRNLNQEGKYYFRIPKELIVEFEETTSKAFMAWQEAKSKDDFAVFSPHLAKIVRMSRMLAEHLGYKDDPYDALLDLYEPGLTAKQTEDIFSNLTPQIIALMAKIKKSKHFGERELVAGGELAYPKQDQEQVANFVLRRMGYDMQAGRMDVSSHPFTMELGSYDVRITNHYKPDSFVESVMVAMHEGGHALYEQGISEEYSLSPLDGGVSLGIHESQSRFWENQVGRSCEFVTFITPVLHAFYADQLTQTGAQTLYRLFNLVTPGFIRVEADEVSYNLHIALRFEIERDLVNDRLQVADLPEVWRAKMKQYLGVAPENDREGVLQDVHWSYGSLGYFPTYTLGNLYAAQFSEAMSKELDLQSLIKSGELTTILSWQRSNIHKWGSRYWPDELTERVTGGKLSAKPFLKYLTDKYSALYKL